MTDVCSHIYVEIDLVYPDGTAKTVVEHSYSRPWAKDGVLYISEMSDALHSGARYYGYPMLHVRSFRSEYVSGQPT